MYLTEEEAKGKVCRIKQAYIVPNEPSGTRYVTESRCIASECMMWRPNKQTEPVYKGYCGLGGKP